MRISLFLLGFIVFLPVSVQAQDSADVRPRYYNAPTNVGAGGASPIMLRQMVRGQTTRPSGISGTGSYYGGQNARPYGTQANNFSLSLSPSEVRARQAQRDAEIRAMEQQKELAAKNGKYNTQQQTDTYLQQFQSEEKKSARKTTTYKKRYIYNRPSTLETPKRVFNSVY